MRDHGLRATTDTLGDRWMAQVVDVEGVVIVERSYSSLNAAVGWSVVLLSLELERRTSQISLLPERWMRTQARTKP